MGINYHLVIFIYLFITDTWFATGIISSGYKCGGKDAYSMYTRLSSYNEWIADKLFEYYNNVTARSSLSSSSSSKTIIGPPFSSFALWILIALSGTAVFLDY